MVDLRINETLQIGCSPVASEQAESAPVRLETASTGGRKPTPLPYQGGKLGNRTYPDESPINRDSDKPRAGRRDRNRGAKVSICF